MNTTLLSLLLLAAIFLLGFFGNQFFKKTKISDILILIIVGLLFGPIFNVIPVSIIEILRGLAPVFATIALIVLLFDGGLYLNFRKVLTEIKNSFLYTIIVFVVTAFACGAALHFIFGFEWLYGLMAGVIVGGTSSAIVIPLITKSSASNKTKTILTLESAMTDIFCVVATITIAGLIISQAINTTSIAQTIFLAFAIASVIGVIGGLFWIRILRDQTEAKEFDYFLTLAFLFVLYVLAEYLGGNGAFCVLVFGLVLGNSTSLLNTFKMKEYTLGEGIANFQREISLLIKTFFFVYLGIIIDIKMLLKLDVILITLALVSLILILRAVSTQLLFSKILKKKDRAFVVALHSRGLASAVLATYPIGLGLINIFTEKIIAIAFLVILITNLSTTVYFLIVEREKDPPASTSNIKASGGKK